MTGRSSRRSPEPCARAITTLTDLVSELRREKFDRKSEKLSPEQYNLPLEDVEVAQGVLEAAQELSRNRQRWTGF